MPVCLLYYCVGHRDTVQHLIENGGSVRLCNVDKDTALHKAVGEGAQKIVLLLCEAGASIAAKNRQGQTPVQIADEKGDTLVIDILSRYGPRGDTLAPEGSFGYTKWQVSYNDRCAPYVADAWHPYAKLVCWAMRS